MQKKHSYFVSAGIIAAIALVLISIIHVILLQDSTRKYVFSLMQDYRREILSGNKTFALRALQKKIGDEYGIVEISYASPGYQKRFIADSYRNLANRSVADFLYFGKIHQDLYFDASKTELAMSFEFYFYRFSNFGFSFSAWLAFCVILGLVLVQFYRFEKKNEEIRSGFERSASISRIVQMISHDMRAPLGTIESLLHIDAEKFPSMKDPIRASLNRLHAMIESLRYSEAEVVVRRSVQELDFSAGFEGVRGKAAERNLQITLPVRGHIWASMDQMKFERAWMNLLTNAIDIANSKIEIVLERQDTDLLVRVMDDGPGVPDEFLPRLFQRGATHRKHDGTGLGLAYVRQIMRGHGGDVTYRRENDMTIFECYLPNAVVEVDKDEQQEPKEVKRSTVMQVSICFVSIELSQRVFDRLSGLSQDSYHFVLGPSQESTIVLTDSEEISDQTAIEGKRLLMFDPSITDDEIVRRVPFRLGIKG